jgi:uncharacterized membrane protein YeaQ/YmgE (transglycosylase-associated protein family)
LDVSSAGKFVAFRSAKVAWIERYFRGAKGDRGLSFSMSELELSPIAQHWALVVLVWIGFGTLAGLLARAVLPAGEPSSPLPNLALGIVGSAVGLAILSWAVENRPLNPISPLGFLAAIGGAFLLLLLYRAFHPLFHHSEEEPADGEPKE